MALDCLVKKVDVDGTQAVILGLDESKGSSGGGFTYLKSVLEATLNRDSLPDDVKPLRPETPILMNARSLYLTYRYDPAHTDFTSGLQIQCYSTRGLLGRSYVKVPAGNLDAQIATLPPALQETMRNLLRVSNRYNPQQGVSELLGSGNITQDHLARFGGPDTAAKLGRT